MTQIRKLINSKHITDGIMKNSSERISYLGDFTVLVHSQFDENYQG